MFDSIQERAREIGKLLSRTDEYQAVKRANDRLAEDRETITLMNRLADLEDQITAYLRAGREPEKEVQEEFSNLAEKIQQQSAYQAVVAAQSNFERLMGRINEEIAQGLEAGEQSRIILP
ncbi:MAG TPA: YlbF family regulator [Longimicrobiaceae bacterium]|nr:YlbF family regulator [Longimicrobiaceae bacterium]